VDDLAYWATYDSLGQLVVARQGVVTIYGLAAMNRLNKRFECAFESLAPKKPT
jgi:hypothetical protein